MLLNLVSSIGAVGIGLTAIIIGSLKRRVEAGLVVILVGGLTLGVAWQILVRFIQIECDQPSCHGRVSYHWGGSQDPYLLIIHYVCNDCEHETNAPFLALGGSWD